jgi:hypothetical protein
MSKSVCIGIDIVKAHVDAAIDAHNRRYATDVEGHTALVAALVGCMRKLLTILNAIGAK